MNNVKSADYQLVLSIESSVCIFTAVKYSGLFLMFRSTNFQQQKIIPVCLFSWRYNPLWLYFPQPGSGL